MEKRNNDLEKRDSEIVFSKAVKAGKRIYYLDVKKSRNDDLYLSITESKKRIIGNYEDGQVSYEKHKIFLYKEDFEEFLNSLNSVVDFVKEEVGEPIVSRAEYVKRYEAQQEMETVAEEEPKQTETKSRSFFDKFRL